MAETMNMVERVARAMAASNGTIWGGPRGEDDPDFMLMRVAYLNSARAAIKAMREPTRAMLSSARGYEDNMSESSIEALWEMLIDAALSEGGK